ncbi:MAG: acetyl-CoA hydrolase/transferase family protein, partial [Pseudobacter sp.]|uniref:acetyl-CoA hydrolase/transferase family protein n=1 Tax=Pseudobacter sp. TaxID=2045420 RepID=UPI003F7DBF8E
MMYQHKYKTAAEAVQLIRSGQRVFIHGSAATPVPLVKALQKRHEELEGVELVSITMLGELDLMREEYQRSFFMNSLFVSASVRDVVNQGRGDYVPVFLSQIPQLFKKKILPVDVALIQVSPPDKHGFCTLGTSVDIARSAVDMAETVIALVNPLMPRTHGNGMVHVSKIDVLVDHTMELPVVNYSAKIDPAVERIGELVASLIPNGATLQLGIGNIPDQVLKNLAGHRQLGLHTEMFSDGVVPLIEKGIIDNSLKKLNPGRSVSSFLAGTRRLYDFVDDNPAVVMMDIGYVNDPSVIRQN